VVELSEAYFNNGAGKYYTDNLVFYYASNTAIGLGGLNATFNLRDDNGKTYYGKTAGASFYIDTPTVDKFDAKWANFPGPMAPVRAWGSASGGLLTVGGYNESDKYEDGITWTANVAAPSYGGGGQFTFVQLVDTRITRIKSDGTTISHSTDLEYVLDTEFPYCEPQIVGKDLIARDSPTEVLRSDDSSVTRYDWFKLYLMYQPDGEDSIWVTLSLMPWNWGGIAVKSDYGPVHWELTTGVHGGGTDHYNTTILPEWNKNIADLVKSWI
ncbi:MAG: hypothetical protein FWC50_09615, partial [Planctomycetaceae bacterium]|nr:hypothetical protein [Planctomycetaceae bacterium]